MTRSERRRAIVHVGCEKTGSTSIQHALAAQRDTLRGAGFLFPASPGSPNHTKLVAACLDEGAVDTIKGHQMAQRGLSERALRSRLLGEYAKELAGDDWHTLLISSELVHSRLHEPSEIARLLDEFLRPFVDEIVILAVLRRQDRLAVSRFSSALRAGHPQFDGMFGDLSAQSWLRRPRSRVVDDLEVYFDYAEFLGRFEGLGPDVRVVVGLYDPPDGRGDPLALFYDTAGIHETGLRTAPERMNAGMSAEAQYVIAALNAQVPTRFLSGARNVPFQKYKRELEAELAGAPRAVARSEAEAFLARYEASNEAVRARYFPDQRTLFREGFEGYANSIDYSDLPSQVAGVLERARAHTRGLPRGEAVGSRLKRGLRGRFRRVVGR